MGITIITRNPNEIYANSLFNMLHRELLSLCEVNPELVTLTSKIDELHHDFMNVIQSK